MKKIVLLFVYALSVSLPYHGYTQSKKADYRYAEAGIKFSAKGTHKRTDIDFGNSYPIIVDGKDEIIGYCKKFDNGVDVMNYMTGKGWECFDTQIIRLTHVRYLHL